MKTILLLIASIAALPSAGCFGANANHTHYEVMDGPTAAGLTVDYVRSVPTGHAWQVVA